MRVKKKVLYLTLFFITVFLLFNIESYAGTQNWNALNYNVTLTPSGDMCVEETWNVDISYTNTLYKTFEIEPLENFTANKSLMSNTEYSCEIKNVKVSEIKNGQEVFLNKIYEQQYHVDSGCFYAMPIKASEFEIAWNVGLDDSSGTRTYKLYYTIEDAIKIYNDCTELYWKFLGENNKMTGKNITGTIKLPQPVEDIEKLRVWAHGPLTGNINKDSNDTISFTIPEIFSNTMLEVRVVTEENIYEDSLNIENSKKLNSILEEEQIWVKEANALRNKYRMIYLVLIIVIIFLTYYFIKKIHKYNKLKKELTEKYEIENQKIKYFREIPNEIGATPARAMYLYSFKNNDSKIDKYCSNIFTATLLDLSLKELIKFESIDEKNFKIILNKPKDKELTGDEENVYKILTYAIDKKEGKNYITTKEFSKYTKEHYRDLYNVMKNFETSALNYQFACGNFDSKKEILINDIDSSMSGHVIFIILSLMATLISTALIFNKGISVNFVFFIIIMFAISFVGNLLCIWKIKRILKRVTVLSEKGMQEQNEWKALKRYLEDFSLLKEKLIPDIVLWEKFLVYATAFGISKKVIKQLRVTCPEMFESRTQNYSKYTYWNVVCDSNFSENMFNNFRNSMERNYQTSIATYRVATSYSSSSNSSGSGSGGGFSSGGGGRWTAEVAAEVVKTKDKISKMEEI